MSMALLPLLLLPAAAASADTFCVDTTGCDGGHTTTNLQTALTMAQTHSGDDTVRIGNVTKSAPGGFSYDSAEPVHIEGTGGRDFGPATLGGTTLKDSTADPNNQIVLLVIGSSASTISGIDVSVPGGTGSDNVGIYTTAAISNVIVHPDVTQPPSSPAIGVRLDTGGSLSSSDVLMSLSTSSSAVRMGGTSLSVHDVTLRAEEGVTATAIGDLGTIGRA